MSTQHHKRYFTRLALGCAVMFVLLRFGWHPSSRPAQVANGMGVTAVTVEMYGSMPKGITLEGVATGIEKIKTVSYNKELNRFKINGEAIYRVPIAKKKLLELVKALSQDDRLGISLLLNGSVVVYGRMSKRAQVVRDLEKADKVMGGVVLGLVKWLDKIKLPEEYKPRRPRGRHALTVIYGNFTDFDFTLKQVRRNESIEKCYERASLAFNLSLIPVSRTKRAADGGFLPDYDKISKGEYEPEYKANLDHFERNKKHYVEKTCLAQAARIAETAAFIRYLRDSKINLKKLHGFMK